MRATLGIGFVLVLTATLTPAAAESQTTAETHIAHIMRSYPGAPNGAGFLAVAEADASLAADHSRLAGSDRTDIAPMVRHARHVLHTLYAIGSGPGSGMGVGPAADAIARHIELAAQAEGASENVRGRSVLVAVAARAVYARAAAMRDVANRIVATTDYVEAYNLVQELQRLAPQLVTGADASGDGTVSLAEGGLEDVRAYMVLMTAAPR